MGEITAQLKNKIGRHIISNIDFNTWIKDTEVVVKKKKKKEVVNKIFEDLSKIIKDKFWQDKFINASIGKFPQKFSFCNGFLKYKKGTKSYTKEISKCNDETSLECINFFNTYGIFSPNDITKSKEIELTAENNREILTWDNSNEKIKDLLISYYVSDIMNVMNLTIDECKQLKQTIMIAIAFKELKKSHFFVENNRLVKIDNIIWDNINRMFYIKDIMNLPTNTSISPFTFLKCKESNHSKDQQNVTILKWEKYLVKLYEKIDKHNKIHIKSLSNIKHESNQLNKAPVSTLLNTENKSTESTESTESTPVNDFTKNAINSTESEVDSYYDDIEDIEDFEVNDYDIDDN